MNPEEILLWLSLFGTSCVLFHFRATIRSIFDSAIKDTCDTLQDLRQQVDLREQIHTELYKEIAQYKCMLHKSEEEYCNEKLFKQRMLLTLKHLKPASIDQHSVVLMQFLSQLTMECEKISLPPSKKELTEAVDLM